MSSRYTVAELRSKTREILNQALTEAVVITRYDDEFVLMKNPKPGADPNAITTRKIEKPSDVTKAVSDNQHIDFCQHGAAPGFCKVQKCPNSKRR